MPAHFPQRGWKRSLFEMTPSRSTLYWGCFLHHRLRNCISWQERRSYGMSPLMVCVLKDFYQDDVKWRWKCPICSTHLWIWLTGYSSAVGPLFMSKRQKCCAESCGAILIDWLIELELWQHDMCPDDAVWICQWTDSFLPEALALREHGERMCWRFSLKKECVWEKCEELMPQGHVWMFLSGGMVLRGGVEASPYHQDKVVTSVCCLTTLEPCLVQARVKGGFPVHAQVKAASIPISTVIGLGSDSSLGPTTVKQHRQPVTINKRLLLKSHTPQVSKYTLSHTM